MGVVDQAEIRSEMICAIKMVTRRSSMPYTPSSCRQEGQAM